MLTLYMSCKVAFLFKAAKTPHATPGHVTTLRDIMLLTNFRNAPLFITFASPQSIRLNHQVIIDNNSACLRQVEVLGPKRSRVNTHS